MVNLSHFSVIISHILDQCQLAIQPKKSRLACSPATSDATQHSMIARQVMEAGFGKMALVDYCLTDFGDHALYGV